MIFKPENFQTLPPDEPRGLRADAGKTLILIKANGTACYARTMTTKDELLDRYVPSEDLLLLAWTGQWRTDIFVLTKEDINTRYL